MTILHYDSYLQYTLDIFSPIIFICIQLSTYFYLLHNSFPSVHTFKFDSLQGAFVLVSLYLYFLKAASAQHHDALIVLMEGSFPGFSYIPVVYKLLFVHFWELPTRRKHLELAMVELHCELALCHYPLGFSAMSLLHYYFYFGITFSITTLNILISYFFPFISHDHLCYYRYFIIFNSWSSLSIR